MSTTSGAVGGKTNTVLFIVLGLLFVFAIVDFAWLYYNTVQDRKAVAYTTQIQVSSQQLAKYAAEAAAGNELAFQELKSTSENMDAYVRALNSGDRTGMPSYASIMQAEVGGVTASYMAGVSRMLMANAGPGPSRSSGIDIGACSTLA